MTKQSGRLWFTVTLPTALALLVLAGRFVATGTDRYRFLVWNLFLAWIPFACAAALAELRRRNARAPRTVAALAVGWVLFLPNAPYLVTDFVHLLHDDGFSFWYDLALIAAFAWAGLVLAVTSLRLVAAEAHRQWGPWAARAVIVASTLVTGVGVYLGRVLRWNSWDVVARPAMIARWCAAIAADPLTHRRGVVISLVFAAFLAVCYATFGDTKEHQV